MAVKQDCCSVPQGKFYIGDYSGFVQPTIGAGVLMPDLSLIRNQYLGLTEDSQINYELEEPDQANMDTRAGGLACATTYLRKAMWDVTVVCNSAETRALAALGAVREFATGAVTNEQHSIVKNPTSAVARQSRNLFVPFNYVPDPTVAYSVQNIAGTTTYVEGTDYIKAETGIEIPPTSTIADSVGPTYAPTVKFGYTRLDTQRVDGLITLSKNYAVYFDGFDRMSGSSRQGWIYNAIGSAKSIPIKSKEMVKIQFSLKLLPDTRIPYSPSSPTSQYFHLLNS
jgi:hypothetical protein